MASKHTPGPWRVSVSYRGKDRQRSDYVIRAASDNLPDGSRVALVEDGRHVLDPKPNQEVEANASLIAAAPDLLEALAWAKDIIAMGGFEKWPDANGWDAEAFKIGVAQMQAAIDKATGTKSE